VSRDIDEASCDVAHALAGIEAAERSRHERKKVVRKPCHQTEQSMPAHHNCRWLLQQNRHSSMVTAPISEFR